MDTIERQVKQILADAFAKAYRPRLTIDVCERCTGEGKVFDTSTLSESLCPRCFGSGEEPA